MIYEIYTENGTKKKRAVTGNGYGLPLGTWISYEGDCPDGFIESEQTFNTTTYAALYALLGTNKVPARFDHSVLSDYELSTFTTTNTQVQFDGELTFRYNGTSVWVYVNDVQIADAGDIYGSTTIQSSATISFKKGDNIRFSTAITNQYVRYYKRHLAIKATPAYVEPDTVSDMVDLILKHESPDWGNAVNVSLSTTGYVCPDDGWIAFEFYTTIANQDIMAYINNILCAESYNGGNWSYGGRGVVKVNKNDVVTLNVNIPNGHDHTKFIPHK